MRHEHSAEIDGRKVSVQGKTGLIHATWVLSIDGRIVDSAKAAGDFSLREPLPEGPPIEASVHQSLIGPTRVVIRRGGEEITRTTGFVA